MKPWEMNWEQGNTAIEPASATPAEPWNNNWQQAENPEIDVNAYNGTSLIGEPGEDAKPFEKMSLFMKKLFTFEVRDAAENRKNNPRIQTLEKLRREGFDDVKWGEVGKSAVRGFFEVGKGVTASPLKIYGDWAMDNRDTSLMTPREKAEVKRNNFHASLYKRLGEGIEKLWNLGLNAEWLKQDEEIFEGSFVENPSMTRALSLGASAAPSIGWLGGLAKLTGSTTLASVMLAGADADDIYFEAREAGASQNKALSLFAAGTAGTAAFDKYGFERMFSQKVTAPLAKRVVNSMLSEGVTEGTQTLWQNMVKKYGYDDSQELWEAVIESVIGGALSGGAVSAANAGYIRLQDVRGRLKEKGMTDNGLDQVQETLVQEMGFHREGLEPLFQTRIEQSLNKLDDFVKQSEETADAKKTQQIKADLDEVYNKVFDQIKTSDIDKVAAAQAKVVQGVALWGSQELGISPLEYFEQRFPRIERVAYRDFARRLNEAKRTGEVAEINLYEALKNPSLLKGQKVKDTRQSLTQFLKQNGGLKDFGGELKAMDADKQVIGLINNKNGRNLDDMALAAWEAGYFPQNSERPTVNDLLDAIGEELGGRKRYNEEAPYSLEDEVNQLAEDLDRINIDWRNMEAPEIEMAVDAYMERQRAYNEEMGQEDIGSDELPWFQLPVQAYNKQGKADVNSEAFKRWFGDSKVVDESGQPLKMVHFSGNEFSQFDKNRTGINNDESAVGFWFADKDDFAFNNEYHPVRYDVYLKMDNPLIIEGKGTETNPWADTDIDNLDPYTKFEKMFNDLMYQDPQMWDERVSESLYGGFETQKIKLHFANLSEERKREVIKSIVDKLKTQGYDGIIIKNTQFDSVNPDEKINQYVVFEPNQIKSVYNRGTFDPNNDNIYYQGRIAENGHNVELTINSQEEMQGLSDEDFKNKMLDTLKSFKGNKIFNQSLNGDIEIRTSSIKKYKSFFADKNKRLIVPYIPELLAKAKFVSENTYTPETESNIIAYWKADLPINIDNDTFNVHLTVKEDNNGNFFWDAQVKEKAPRTDPATNPGDKGLQSSSADPATNPGVKGLTSEVSEDGLSITPTRENVNNPLYQSAFAGSRVDYDTPSLEAIGTGEGAQAHGWGLYYALSRDVAEGYRKKFIKNIKEIELEGKVYKSNTAEAFAYFDYILSNKDIASLLDSYRQLRELYKEDSNWGNELNELNKKEKFIKENKDKLDHIKEIKYKGQVHEVDLPENPYLLDEDTAVWQQSEIVKDGISNLVDKLSDEQVGQLQVGQYDVAEKREILKSNLQSETGRKLYKTLTNVLGSKQAASEMLESVGIKGITYDGNQDGRCFVIFNPADVKVIQKFYQDGADTLYRDPKGAFSQRIDRRAVISLFERADASTFMHETAHFFFEELKAFAPTSEKSAQMLKTVNDWLGSDGASYTVEQTEQFARGFEQYLREGKAPSSYLKRVFDAFMNWMRNLYKTAKELNVKLNDEVRGVYGEILGGADLDRYMDAPVAEVLGQTKRYWKAKREAMDDIYKQNVDAKKASARLFKRGRETMQNVYTDMRNYLSDAIVPLEEEIKQISPELYNMNRRLEIDKLQKTSAYYKRVKGFVDGMQKMDAPDFYTFDLALKNRDVDTVQRLLEKYALTDGFAEVRNILDDLREQMIDVGVDVAYMPDYFPRKIKDADGLLDYVEQEFGGRPEYSIIQKMIEEKRKDGRIRTKEDEAQIVNSLIRGYAGGISIAKIGNVKERSIDVVDQYMNRFYKVSTDALTDYISGAVQMIENKKYFGRETKELQNLRKMVANRETTIADYKAMEPKEAKWKEIKTRNYKIGAVEAQIRNTYDKDVKAELQDRKTKLEAEVEFLRNRRAEQVKEIAINRMEVELAQVKKEVDDLADSKIENSVGNLLLEMAEQGKISHTQELRLKELLLARFSNQGLGNEFLRLLRDGGYIWTLGNFESAITQFGDLGTSAYKNGLWNTAFEYVKAWQGRSEITINDLGLEKIIQDGGYADTSAWSKALDKVLKYTGFEKMDKIAKQTLVNSAVRKARADAKAESPELEAYLRHEFGEKWVDVKEDLKTGAVTDEIMEYAMFQLLDVQPITIDQMPRYYAEGGKKRLFYMMKSYFIKQLNEYRKICFETAKSNPRKAVVDMTRLTVYLMLFNAGADVLKDLLFGRPVNVPDSLVDNIFIGGSINRYQAMSVKREGLFKTLQKQLLFPVMLDELVVDILSDKEVKDWNTWKNVPLVGRPYYWWFGGGHLKTLKEEKKARNERRNQRRRRRDD